jgi:hypothetical protein
MLERLISGVSLKSWVILRVLLEQPESATTPPKQAAPSAILMAVDSLLLAFIKIHLADINFTVHNRVAAATSKP